MSQPKKSTIEVQGAAITVLSQQEQGFICLTDIARYKNSERKDYLLMNLQVGRVTRARRLPGCPSPARTE